jgi:uncharacterized protein YlxP (DUF503 family)
MHVLALRLELHLPHSQSLKARRAILRPIIDGGRHRFPVAIAEVGHHDVWQRAAVGVAGVSNSVGRLEQLIDEVERFVWSFPDVDVIDTRRRWLDVED